MTENHPKTSFTFLLALVAFRRKTLHNSGAEARALSDLCAVSARRATGANRKIHFEVTSGDLPPPFCYSGRQKCLPGGAPTCPTGEALFPTAVAKSELLEKSTLGVQARAAATSVPKGENYPLPEGADLS